MSALPNKVDLTKELINTHEKVLEKNKLSSNKLKPLISHQDAVVAPKSDKKPALEYERIPTHKYPFQSEEVTVDELRNRVYKGSTGVLPARQSQELEELNFILKGKPIQKESQPNEDTLKEEPNLDETFNNIEQYSDDENQYTLRPNLNTPVTATAFAYYEMSGVGSGGGDKPNYPVYLLSNSTVSQAGQQKPAILSSTGTLGHAVFSERPKPEKKKKVDEKYLPKKRKKALDSLEQIKQLLLDPNVSKKDIEQIKLENELILMLNEAREIRRGSQLSSDHPVVRPRKKTNLIENETDLDTVWSMINTANKERHRQDSVAEPVKSLPSVEHLISAIKSGELVKGLESSNKRIQDILGTILDKKSLQMFDDLFDEDKEKEVDEKTSLVAPMDAINEISEATEDLMQPSVLSNRLGSSKTNRSDLFRQPSGLILESARLVVV